MQSAIPSGRSVKHLRSACVPCHNSKLSCDEVRPCRRCRLKECVDACVEYQGLKRGRRSKHSTSHAETLWQVLPARVEHPDVLTLFRKQHTVFSMILTVLQITLEKHRSFPSPTAFHMLLSQYRPALSLQHLQLLAKFCTHFGNQTYLNILSAPVVSPERLRIIDHLEQFAETVEKIPQALRKYIMTPDQWDDLPMPVAFVLVETAKMRMFFHINKQHETTLGYPTSEHEERFSKHFYYALQLFIHPDYLAATIIQMGLFTLTGASRFTVNTAAVLSNGSVVPIAMKASVVASEDGLYRVISYFLSVREGPVHHSIRREPGFIQKCLENVTSKMMIHFPHRKSTQVPNQPLNRSGEPAGGPPPSLTSLPLSKIREMVASGQLQLTPELIQQLQRAHQGASAAGHPG
eukprot:GILJ01005254.1.p1 GENE.GILJ01005254.1~~GILJ01005254.1.p1  ORF type:complete len:406 (+),score=46.57 GILJ01005254.1:90-1307(+)